MQDSVQPVKTEEVATNKAYIVNANDEIVEGTCLIEWKGRVAVAIGETIEIVESKCVFGTKKHAVLMVLYNLQHKINRASTKMQDCLSTLHEMW